MKWPDWLLVFFGGGFGSVTRYLISKHFDPLLQTLFPFATLISNSLACLVLGFIYATCQQKNTNSNLWLLIAIGFCGGFSTFSSFTLSNFQLFQNGFSGIALINIAGTFLLCLLFLYLGIGLQKLI